MLIRIIHQSGTHIRGIEKGKSILCVDSATADTLSPAQPIKFIQPHLRKQLEDCLTTHTTEELPSFGQRSHSTRQAAVRTRRRSCK